MYRKSSQKRLPLGGLVVLFSGKIICPVEEIKNSERSWEKDPGENINLFGGKFVILAPDSQPVTGQPGGQYGS